MGFGILLIGYLFAFGFTAGSNYVVSLLGLLGSVLLFIASTKLSVYTKHFGYARISALALALSYVVSAILSALKFAGTVDDASILLRISRALIIACVFAFHIFMYLGVADISREVEDKKLYTAACRDVILLVAYYLVTAFARVSSFLLPAACAAISLFATVLGLVWLVLSFWLVMSSYMRICLPEDKDMSPKGKK